MYSNTSNKDLSFSIVEGSDFNLHEAINSRRRNDEDDSGSDRENSARFTRSNPSRDLSDSDSEDSASEKLEVLKRQPSAKQARPMSARPDSHRPKSPHPLEKLRAKPTEVSLRSNGSDTEDEEKNKVVIPGEYDPNDYRDLDVNDEIKELFQYISKYTPQNLNLDYKFKPFIPEFIPAVGDVDAFLKIEPPEKTLNGDEFNVGKYKLGLSVLDEPASIQSDPALLHLQLRASSVNVTHARNMVVKKVGNVEKNSKVIDKWIKDISDLHKSKSSPVVKYSDPMPDLDDLMQEWPEAMENLLKLDGFPSHRFNGSLSSYINIVCCLFDIPMYKNKIQSLHLLFCLYAVIKNSQLYRSTVSEGKQSERENSARIGESDQLVLE